MRNRVFVATLTEKPRFLSPEFLPRYPNLVDRSKITLCFDIRSASKIT